MNNGSYEFKVSAAGRVNLIGEHVDYCGGKVLPCALSLKNTVSVRPNGTNTLNIAWTDLSDRVSLDLDKLESYRGEKHARYIAGSAFFWRQAGHRLVGCDMLYDCTVPFGSGLSSSAAIEVSTIAALTAAAGEKFEPVAAALAAQRAEHEFAGVNCGIMDQYVSAAGKANNALLLDCSTLECEYIPVRMGDCSLVIANCNKPHSLVESKYNERREEVETALRILRRRLDVSSLAAVPAFRLEEYRSALPPIVYRRAKHVVEECARVAKAASALRLGDMKGFGALLNASHRSLSELYEVTGRELDALAHAAQRHPSCYGSRMTGAGFGGCTVSVVRTGGLDNFMTYVTEEYQRETGYEPTFYTTHISDGVEIMRL